MNFELDDTEARNRALSAHGRDPADSTTEYDQVLEAILAATDNATKARLHLEMAASNNPCISPEHHVHIAQAYAMLALAEKLDG